MASLDTLPQCVSSCWELLHSEAFFLLLSNFTGLRLHYLCPADDDSDDDKVKDEKKVEKNDELNAEATASSTESQSTNTSREKGACQFLLPQLNIAVCGCV